MAIAYPVLDDLINGSEWRYKRFGTRHDHGTRYYIYTIKRVRNTIVTYDYINGQGRLNIDAQSISEFLKNRIPHDPLDHQSLLLKVSLTLAKNNPDLIDHFNQLLITKEI